MGAARESVALRTPNPTPKTLSGVFGLPLDTHAVVVLKHGFHNVSRWMTWLPISLKNAAKCDKWYQLQNHSITESLNANGAREKSSPDHPRACRISQCRTKTQSQKSLGLVKPFLRCGRSSGCSPNEILSLHEQCIALVNHQNTTNESLLAVLRLTITTTYTPTSFVTDLSAAGSPAELKHITQRRKRKQP